MCIGVEAPKPPKPAPITPPAPTLDQAAPDPTKETARKDRARSLGTRRYRAGSALQIPGSTSSGPKIPGIGQ